MAMLPQKFKRFNRRKGKSGFRFRKPINSSNTGKTGMFFKVECYNCGKIGHYASIITESYSKATKYKAKYKAMKVKLKADCKEKKKTII